MSAGVQLAIAGGIILVALVLIALGRRKARHAHAHPVYVWSCEVGGTEWSYRAELVGGVWSLSCDHGGGGLFGSLTEVREWVARDIARRTAVL